MVSCNPLSVWVLGSPSRSRVEEVVDTLESTVVLRCDLAPTALLKLILHLNV